MLNKKRVSPKRPAYPKKRKATPRRLKRPRPPSISFLPPIPAISELLTPVELPAPKDVRSSTEMPRILMVMDQFNIGGTETYTLTLTRELLKKGYTVMAAGKKGKLLDSFLGLGCPCFEIDFVLDNFKENLLQRRANTEILQSIIRTEGIDLVHTHQIPSGGVAIAAANELRVPVVFTVHGTYYDREFLHSVCRGTTLTSVSPSVQLMLQTRGIHHSFLIPNGIDPLEFSTVSPTYRAYLRQKLGIPPSAPVVMYAGRLSWEKADICNEIIHAVSAMRGSSHPNLHCLIAGGGRQEEHVFKLATLKHRKAKKRFIHHVGEVLNMKTYYAISDCIIGTGRIALEAMACERPLVAIGSKSFFGLVNPDHYEDAWDSWFGDHGGNRGLLRYQLIEHLRTALDMDEVRKRKLVQDGKEWVSAMYPVSQTTAKMIEVYSHALKGNPAEIRKEALQ
ncbi:glycosyltransferase [Paenibacillus filicis]|uniref:Glycosyltransferase n=1 Tax=Paenibacillus filicis TaxID=669464 RepID=A0ABU9DTR2_9BACL